MKIFLDTAEVEQIKKAVEVGIIDGVTTNPTLIYRAGRSDFKKAINEICKLVDPGPVSAEVISQDSEGMVKEARELSKITNNVVVKIPMTLEGMKAVKELSRPYGWFNTIVKTNVTLVFSANQALLAAKAGANYVSPFVGRLDDRGERGMGVVKDILTVFRNYDFKTQVIVASCRNVGHVKEAALLGAHIATIPFKVWEQLFLHPLTDAGIKKFLEDWKKVK